MLGFASYFRFRFPMPSPHPLPSWQECLDATLSNMDQISPHRNCSIQQCGLAERRYADAADLGPEMNKPNYLATLGTPTTILYQERLIPCQVLLLTFNLISGWGVVSSVIQFPSALILKVSIDQLANIADAFGSTSGVVEPSLTTCQYRKMDKLRDRIVHPDNLNSANILT
jgi:hypothetical protein